MQKASVCKKVTAASEPTKAELQAELQAAEKRLGQLEGSIRRADPAYTGKEEQFARRTKEQNSRLLTQVGINTGTRNSLCMSRTCHMVTAAKTNATQPAGCEHVARFACEIC
jgi:hypothetical protein